MNGFAYISIITKKREHKSYKYSSYYLLMNVLYTKYLLQNTQE